jgi:hypothetical protein
MVDINDMIMEQLKAIREKLDRIAENGCSKALSHVVVEKNLDGIFKRVNQLEVSQAEGRGKLAIFVALASSAASAIITLGITWITKHMQ